jgi:hypothetical protein
MQFIIQLKDVKGHSLGIIPSDYILNKFDLILDFFSFKIFLW